jgi:hypothetical protein
MRRVFAPVLVLVLAVGCGSDTRPTGEKPPSASEAFDKTDKDLKPRRGEEKKASGFG